MKALYTLVIECDGGDEVAQEIAESAAEALDQWTRRRAPEGILDALSPEDQQAVEVDFSASKPTHFGIDVPVDGLEGVWRASTSLESGKHVNVVCVRCSPVA